MTGQVSQRVVKVVSVQLSDVLKPFDIDTDKYRLTGVSTGHGMGPDDTTLEINLIEIPKNQQRRRD